MSGGCPTLFGPLPIGRAMSLLNIETARLILRPFVASDAVPLVRLYQDPDVIRFMKATRVSTDEMIANIRSHGERYYRDRGFGALAGVSKATGSLVGRYALMYSTVDGVEELNVSYLTAAEYRGQGLATEAVRALLDAAWAHGFSRVAALIFPENLPSQRVADRVGFRFERNVVFEGSTMRLYAATAQKTTVEAVARFKG